MENTFLGDYINSAVIDSLDRLRLNLSHLWLLERASLGLEIDDTLKKSSIYQTLSRKNYICNDRLTDVGRALYEALISKKETVKTTEVIKDLKKEKIEKFQEWWNSYPANNRVLDNNGSIIFKETRALRTAKEWCQVKYLSLLDEGIPHEILLGSLKYEVNMRRTSSLGGQNHLTYMQNSKTYLNQRSYEAFIELAKESTDSPTKNNLGTISI